MLSQEILSETITDQKNSLKGKDLGVSRSKRTEIKTYKHFSTILTGIRRCGKSTLLQQLLAETSDNYIYLNFEDIRLTSFTAEDFTRLYREIKSRGVAVLFFDEIQIVSRWEIFVNQLLNEDYFVYITGSNASLLSGELATHLTGRHLSYELFPFSYQEFLAFKKLEKGAESLNLYLELGGMPEFLATENTAILRQLLSDILIRDIAVRYGIRDVAALKQLAVYLFSNAGNLVSARKLTSAFSVKSPATILEYFSHLKNTYLFDFVPQFSWSLNAQHRNPKKIYAVDNGFINAVSVSHSRNTGYKLENLVYTFLRRTGAEIFYFSADGECDFIVRENGSTTAIQVCSRVDDMNMPREFDGLVAALDFFGLSEGCIVTLDQEDEFTQNGKKISLIPAHEFLYHGFSVGTQAKKAGFLF